MQFDPDDPRWTAYVLSELDAADAADLEQELEHSAAARQFVDELRQTVGILSAELEAEPVLQLSAEQRAAIDRESRLDSEREARTQVLPAKVSPASARDTKRQTDFANRWLGVLVAVAASLLVVATLVVPGLQNANAPAKVAQSDPGVQSKRWDAEDYQHLKRAENSPLGRNNSGWAGSQSHFAEQSNAAGQGLGNGRIADGRQLGENEKQSKDFFYAEGQPLAKGLAKGEVDFTAGKSVYDTNGALPYTINQPVYETKTRELCYTVAKPTYEAQLGRYANSPQRGDAMSFSREGLLNGYVATPDDPRFGDQTSPATPTTGPGSPLGDDAYRGVVVKAAAGAGKPTSEAGRPDDWGVKANLGGVAAGDVLGDVSGGGQGGSGEAGGQKANSPRGGLKSITGLHRVASQAPGGGAAVAGKPRGGIVITGQKGDGYTYPQDNLSVSGNPGSTNNPADPAGAPPVYYRTANGTTASGPAQPGQPAGGTVALHDGKSIEGLKQLTDNVRQHNRYYESEVVDNFTVGLDVLSSNEAYDDVTDNAFLPVGDNPLSTFSIDVDTASYSNMRRFVTQNHRLPPKNAVRIEEMLNYFSYDYPQPDGDAPFSANAEVAECPWNVSHRLVRIGLKGREIAAQKRPPSNLVLLVDVSGSMNEPNKLPLVKQSLRMLAEQLGENDRVAIVVYAGNSGLALPSTTGNNRETIITTIDRLEAGGSTNGGQGIQLAYEIALRNFIAGGTNRVLLLTDGDFNVGITDRGKLVEMIEQQAKSGVFLTTLGYGFGNLKDATLEQLADHGNGNYAYIDDVREAKKVFVEQMSGTLITIAKDVKIQIEFNPSQVGSYRLIGYENRILAHQDFNNDAKDAGDIGAGHTVTALYEIVPPAAADARPVVDPLKYQQQNKLSDKAQTGELLTLKLRYKQPEAKESKLLEYPVKDSGHRYGQATRDFKFAASVAAFGMLLRDSPHKGTATMAGALELAQEGQGSDEKGYRQEFVSLIQQAKSIYDATHPPTTGADGKVVPPLTHPVPVQATGEPIDSTLPLKPADAVHVEWGNAWWKASVIEALPDGNVKIHYTGWESSWDEVVPRSRLRK